MDFPKKKIKAIYLNSITRFKYNQHNGCNKLGEYTKG